MAIASYNVKSDFFIHNFEVNPLRIVTLMSAIRNKTTVGFIDCKLILAHKISFCGSLKGSTVRTLELKGCGHPSKGDWVNNPVHFENLISSLESEQDFKKNLEELQMEGNNMKKAEVEEVLLRYGFNGVRVLGCEE